VSPPPARRWFAAARARRAAKRDPLPDLELIWRVTGARSVEWFRKSGTETVADLNAALATVGSELSRHRRILDFGCGSGRIELRLRDLGEHSELHGVDIDAEAINWAQQNIPWATFQVGPTWPPLPYPAGFFDLVVNHSVFSHLDEQYQDAWLAELERVTASGGLVVLSFHGDHAFQVFCDSADALGADISWHRRERSERGILFVEDDGWVGGPFPDFYHTAFHTPEYVRDRWGTFFDVCGILERRALKYQDIVVLRRR
jgi:SAM-dependent methyltransferase